MNHLISPTLFYYLFIISGLITAGCGNSVDSVGELNVAENWQLQAFEGENVTFLEDGRRRASDRNRRGVVST